MKLHEVTERQKRAFLIDIFTEKTEKAAAESRSGELQRLAASLDLAITGCALVYVRQRQPQFGMGTGKAAELVQQAAESEADCIILDWAPSPSQQRNWENLAGIPVLDRQELIIKIFAERAATREAELQVQLAELIYRLPRLSHKNIDLGRQRGGRYGAKGAGETRLETDRRQVEQRIHRLKKELETVRRQRQLQRQLRQKQGLPVCAIVGYTNAGKSSLLNALSGADALVADQLFATLDATTRRFEPKPGMTALITDTVGFIRQLPHSLIDAFRSTLEEAAQAHLLLHVLDASDPDIEVCHQTSLAVLHELGAQNIPLITVLNKVDCLRRVRKHPETNTLPEQQPQVVDCLVVNCEGIDLDDLRERFPASIPVSAKEKTGLEALKNRIAEALTTAPQTQGV